MKSTQFDSVLGLDSRKGPLAVLGKFVLYGLMVLVFAGPLIGLLVSAFTRTVDPTKFRLIPDNFTLDNFRAAGERNVYSYLFNSFVVVGFGLLLQMVVSVFAAYSLSRQRLGRLMKTLLGIVLALILMTMMLPEEVLAIPLSIVLYDVPIPFPPFSVNLIGTYAGMILPVGAWGFSILVMSEFMKEVPVELEEAARIDGAGELRTFFLIILPLCRPALGVIGVFGFTMIWDQYLLPLIVATEPSQYTLPIALRTLRSDEEVGIGVLLAGALLAMLPSILAFLAFQRQFVRGLTSGAIKG